MRRINNRIILNFENGMPKGTSQQKGEKVIFKNGKPVILHYRKDKVESARREFVYRLKPFRPEGTTAGAIKLTIWFYFDLKDKSRWGKYKTTRADIDNLCKEIIDAMSECGGFWKDDAQIVSLKAEKWCAEKATIVIDYEELEDDKRTV